MGECTEIGAEIGDTEGCEEVERYGDCDIETSPSSPLLNMPTTSSEV